MSKKIMSVGTRVKIRTGIALVLTACMIVGVSSPLGVYAEGDQSEIPVVETEAVINEIPEGAETALDDVSGVEISEDIVEEDIVEENVVENVIAEEEILMGEDGLDCLEEPSLDGASSAMKEGDFEYELKSSKYRITKYTGSDTDLTIPSELGGKKITVIAEGAFKGNATIKKLTIPEGIIEMDGAAFAGCSALESVSIPSTLEKCGTSLEYYYGKQYLYKFAGPFAACDKLKTVSFGNGILSIPDNLFRLCTGLESVTIPDSVKSIGKSAFQDCMSLKEITIPGNAKTIGSEAFRYDTSMTKVVLNEGVEEIGDLAFEGCSVLKEAKLADTIIKLGGAVFGSCSALDTVNIPASLEKCGTSLEYYYSSEYLYKFAGPFAVCDKLKTVTFGKDIQSIPANLFQLCTGLESVTIPDSVKSIGKNAFQDCMSLKEITIPGNVKTIYNEAFRSDTSMTKVVINEGVEGIEDLAFEGCNTLKEVKLADTITYLGGAVFGCCSALETVNIPASLEKCGTSLEYYYSKKYLYKFAGPFAACDRLTTVTFGKGLKSIPANLFRLCTGLETVTLPASVKGIGNNAFADCSSLKKLGIPGSVTTIGKERAIEGDSNLVIYGLDKSVAQEYATQNNIKFEIDPTLGSGSNLDDDSKSSYTVTLDGRNKTATQTVSVKAGEKLTRPATPVLEGYVFTGWFREDACQNQYDFDKTAVEADFTLYAGWTADKAYTGVPAADVRATGKKKFWIAKISACTYTGAAVKPEPQVYNGDTKLVSGVDYTVKYSNNKKAGKATVQVTGKGKYKGKFTLKTTFTIKKRKISESYVSKTFVNTYAKSSKKKNPKLSFKAVSGTKALKKDTDYKITVYNAKGKKVSSYYKAGTYTARITGKGNFDSKDYCELSFTVE